MPIRIIVSVLFIPLIIPALLAALHLSQPQPKQPKPLQNEPARATNAY